MHVNTSQFQRLFCFSTRDVLVTRRHTCRPDSWQTATTAPRPLSQLLHQHTTLIWSCAVSRNSIDNIRRLPESFQPNKQANALQLFSFTRFRPRGHGLSLGTSSLGLCLGLKGPGVRLGLDLEACIDNFCRATLCKCGLSRHAVSVCLCVCLSRS